MKNRLYRELSWVMGMILNSCAIALLVKSQFGISTLSSLPLVLSDIIPRITLGTMTTLVQSILLVIVICITRQPRISYLFSFAIAYIFGLMVDIAAGIFAPLAMSFPLRIVYFAVGWLLISMGGALFIFSGLPLMPNDCAIRDLSVFTGKSVKQVKTVFDVIFVGTAVTLSLLFLHRVEGVGIGTVIMVFFTGTLTQMFIDNINQRWKPAVLCSITDRLVELASVHSSHA